MLAGVLQAPPEHGLVFQVSWKKLRACSAPKHVKLGYVALFTITCGGKCQKLMITGALVPAHASSYSTLQMSLQQVLLDVSAYKSLTCINVTH